MSFSSSLWRHTTSGCSCPSMTRDSKMVVCVVTPFFTRQSLARQRVTRPGDVDLTGERVGTVVPPSCRGRQRSTCERSVRLQFGAHSSLCWHIPDAMRVGAPGRTRTGMILRSADFKSAASTNFATGARGAQCSATAARSGNPDAHVIMAHGTGSFPPHPIGIQHRPGTPVPRLRAAGHGLPVPKGVPGPSGGRRDRAYQP